MLEKIKGRGGLRAGAGRKKGSGKFGEATCCIRVPESLAAPIKGWLQAPGIFCPKILPLPKAYQHFLSKVAAGFPSPADDYLEPSLDLNEYLIQNQASTFFLTVQGDSMLEAGIFDGDLLVVDRSITAVDGKIVIAAINEDITVKRLKIKNSNVYLVPENPAYSAIKITSDLEFKIWGVVTSVIHKL